VEDAALREKSSSAESSSAAIIHRARVSWPVECVPVALEIAHPRKLTALEWALLRVMDAFPDSPPSLEEIAEELGIAESAFLEDALREVVHLRALEPRQGDSWTELRDLRFTEQGRDFFRRNLIEGRPSSHTVELWFDALTDESRSKPKILEGEPSRPLVPAEQLQARSTVGLDRARDVVRRTHPDLLKGNGEILSVSPADRDPTIEWTATDLTFELSHNGSLSVRGQITPKAMEWLSTIDPVEQGLVPSQAFSADWTTAYSCPGPPQVYEAWRRLVARTLPFESVRKEALEIVRGAQRELLLHASWFDDIEIRARATERAKSGLRVFVIGAAATEPLDLLIGPPPGVLVACQCDAGLPLGLVADASRGIRVDSVRVPCGTRSHTLELVGAMDPAASQQVATTFADAAAESVLAAMAPIPEIPSEPELEGSGLDPAHITTAIADPQLGLRIAKFALHKRPSDMASLFACAAAQSQGAARIDLLTKLGAMVRTLAPQVEPEAANRPANEAWKSSLRQLKFSKATVKQAELLAKLAPLGSKATAFVAACMRSQAPISAGGYWEACSLMLQLRDIVDRKWGAGSCALVGEFQEQRRVFTAQLPLPTDLQELGSWFARLKEFRSLFTDNMLTLCSGQVLRLAADLRKASQTNDAEWVTAQREWGDLGLPAKTLLELVGASPPKNTQSPAKPPANKGRRP
jgi:hypothetical protein